MVGSINNLGHLTTLFTGSRGGNGHFRDVRQLPQRTTGATPVQSRFCTNRSHYLWSKLFLTKQFNPFIVEVMRCPILALLSLSKPPLFHLSSLNMPCSPPLISSLIRSVSLTPFL